MIGSPVTVEVEFGVMFESVPPPVDPEIERYTGCRETDADEVLSSLVDQVVLPTLRQALQRRLGNSSTAVEPEWEDLEREALRSILERVRRIRFQGEAPIQDLRSYCHAVALSACAQYLRQRSPARWSAEGRVRYAVRCSADLHIAPIPGLGTSLSRREWPPTRLPDSRRLEMFASSPHEALQAARAERSAGSKLVDAIRRILVWLDGPAPFHTFVEAAVGWLGLAHAVPVPHALPHAHESSWNRCVLEHLWCEIVALPERQRLALLLNLRDESRRGLVDLFPITGTASIEQIAEALGMDACKAGELWDRLPLSDAEIGAMIGASAQEVCNLRAIAKTRIRRRMKAHFGEEPR